MLEAIRKSEYGIADEVSENIFVELRKRRALGGFSEQRIQSVLEKNGIRWSIILRIQK